MFPKRYKFLKHYKNATNGNAYTYLASVPSKLPRPKATLDTKWVIWHFYAANLYPRYSLIIRYILDCTRCNDRSYCFCCNLPQCCCRICRKNLHWDKRTEGTQILPVDMQSVQRRTLVEVQRVVKTEEKKPRWGWEGETYSCYWNCWLRHLRHW